MNRFLTGAAILVFLGAPAFAQSPTSQTPPNAQTNANSTSSSTSLAASQKIRQDLLSAGFTDVKVVSESFVVQAKSKDGDPVLMTIGPRGMSVFEAVNGNNSSASTTTGSSNGSTSSGAQNNPTSKNK
jgi:Tfp pilus assembly protein FimT